ncbi:hypothetical protein AB6A40_003480 [Gnathostoma spinigerum]|uniref:C2H2-type domain-containing protein n=1 Tax=Gnathostoma spinigerum TaxID=75299 RepID=A0ABD6EC49_9BILA
MDCFRILCLISDRRISVAVILQEKLEQMADALRISGCRQNKTIDFEFVDAHLKLEVISSQKMSQHRMERSRDDIAFPRKFGVRNFFAQSARNGEMELWSNGVNESFLSMMSAGGYGMSGATLIPNIVSPPQLSIVYLRCPTCDIGKTSSEDMEVHIKMEHLQWLPFQCPICSAERASDLQMREHIHSAHRKNSNKFIYVDNPLAKRQLQLQMDQCLASARRPTINGNSQHQPSYSNVGGSSSSNGSMRERGFNSHIEEMRQEGGGLSGTSSPPNEPRGESPLRHMTGLSNGRDTKGAQSPQQCHHVPSATATVVSRKRPAGGDVSYSGNSNTDALLSAIRAATNDGEDGSVDACSPQDEINEEEDDISQIYNGKKRVKSEFDVQLQEDSGADVLDDVLLGVGGNSNEDNHDPADILGNVSAMFNADDSDLRTDRRRSSNGIYSSARSKANSSSLSKKRVLGECSKCKKPVTAGARQMHMFFHLGKDYNVYRFRCKYPNCSVEHYRKDQMENHHSKQHGKIDANMMEDRTAELFNSCQELSMELLGTSGNTPGPTAAKAQLAYNASMAAQAMNGGRKKKKANATIVSTPIEPPKPSPPVELEPKLPIDLSDEHELECRLCHKQMKNRIRGFHILWHLAKDVGINRYCCKLCKFGHDRSQSVQTHGKREHGVGDCVIDRIEEYTDEVKSMSESCFGFQAIFSQDGRRRCRGSVDKNSDEGGEEHDDTSDASGSAEHNELVGEDDESNEIEDEEEANNRPEGGKTRDSGEPKEGINAPSRSDHSLCASSADGSSNRAVSPRRADSAKLPVTSAKTETKLADSSKSSSVTPSVPSNSSTHRSRKSTNRRFGVRKPASRLKKKEMARLREMSMKLGGAQYFKKRINEVAHCEKCGVLTTSRISDHAYKHLDVQLFLCPHCDLGSHNRDLVVRHLRDMHNSTDHPVDDRLKYAAEIKEMIRECYPAYFVDAPIPTAAEIEKLKASLKLDSVLAGPDEHDAGQGDDDASEEQNGERENKDEGESQDWTDEGVGEENDDDEDDEQEDEDDEANGNDSNDCEKSESYDQKDGDGAEGEAEEEEEAEIPSVEN